MKKNKGFTLVELLVSFTLLAVVLIYLIKATTNIMQRENDLLMLQEYNIFESTFLNAIYDDIDGLNDIAVVDNENNVINISYNNRSIKNILFSNTNDEKGIYYDNVFYELPTNTEFIIENNKIKYEVKTGAYSEDNYVKDYTIISIPLKMRDEEKNINIIFQNVDKNITPSETYLCKRATITTLHTETCTQTDSDHYCSGAGYTAGNKGTTITYGNLGKKGVLASGDAFDCDVNGDGNYDPETERFYYVSDYYNTSTKEFESDTATLIYYNNVSDGVASNSETYMYDSSGENWHGPVTAITQLPTKSQWSNVSLKNSTRAILNEKGENTTKGGTLPIEFSYENYSARLLTISEVNKACNTQIGKIDSKPGGIDGCNYLMENTKYSSDSIENWGYFLENSHSDSSTKVWLMPGYFRTISIDDANVSDGVRPVIEVSKDNISY